MECLVVSTMLATPEFSRTVSIDEVSAGELRRRLTADQPERAALAARFGLAGLRSLVADARVWAEEQGKIHVKVTFTADVLQSCVVTLEPVSARLNEEFDVVFAPETGEEGLDHDEIVIDVADADPPEPLTGDSVDIGELVAQHVALAIDPYPRKPGVDWRPDETIAAGAGDGGDSPFAVLAGLKDQKI